MQFLVQLYSEDMKARLFDGDFDANRVTFPAFMSYLETNCVYENTPDQYERYMQIFDDDKNGNATIDDVVRVMKTHGQMGQEDIDQFLKIVLGEASGKEMKTFKIPKSTS